MAGNLNKYEVAQYKEAFALFDTNKDGVIDPSELKAILSSLGQECDDREITDLIETADKLGTGNIDFPSFLEQFQHKENEDEMAFFDEAFELIGGGNPIDEAAVKNFLSTIGQNIIEDEAVEIVKLKDKDGDGKIGKEDFKLMWLQKDAEKITS